MITEVNDIEIANPVEIVLDQKFSDLIEKPENGHRGSGR